MKKKKTKRLMQILRARRTGTMCLPLSYVRRLMAKARKKL